jgi:hypothetical protein
MSEHWGSTQFVAIGQAMTHGDSRSPSTKHTENKNERHPNGWTLICECSQNIVANYVLMCLRLALRAFALAGRLPWLAFFSFFADLAISIFLFALNLCCSH